MDEYELLVKKGNIGIYNSCEVTELVIMEPNEIIYNLYTLCVFQENFNIIFVRKPNSFLKSIYSLRN